MSILLAEVKSTLISCLGCHKNDAACKLVVILAIHQFVAELLAPFTVHPNSRPKEKSASLQCLYWDL